MEALIKSLKPSAAPLWAKIPLILTHFILVNFILVNLILVSLIFVGCASPSRELDYDTNNDRDDGSKAHPAAYLTDGFAVHRPLPHHEKNKVPFYFKSCSPAGEKWPIAKTSYECDYP